MPASKKIFKKINDKTIEFEIYGELKSDNINLILLHEGLGSVSMWTKFPEKLHTYTGLNVIVYSRIGYGNSSLVQLPRPLNYMTIEAEIYLPLILKELDINKFFLIGHSDGGTIAALFCSLFDNSKALGAVLVAPHFFIEEFNLTSIKKLTDQYQVEILKIN